MTHPAVGDLPEGAASILLGICEKLSYSRYPGLAEWAASVSDALLIQLASVVSGERVDVVDFEPSGPLAVLDAAELDGLRTVMATAAVASDDDAVIDWCTRMGGLIVADFYRRTCEQVAIDAKVEAIAAEERRLVRAQRGDMPPWSGV